MAKRVGGFIGQDGINAPDEPTGVTGTAGDGQVTVSWTAPSDVGGAAIEYYRVQGSNGADMYEPDLANGSYASKSFSVASQSTSSGGLALKSDGTSFYVGDESSGVVYQYDMTTAFDVSTASYASKSFNTNTQTTGVAGLHFHPDGTKMYAIGAVSNDSVFQYALSTAWDVSTASYESKSFNFSSQNDEGVGLYLGSGGTKMFIAGNTGDIIYQYTLSTAYDVSTASYDSVSFDVTSEDSAPQSMTFNAKGDMMLIGGAANDAVFQYNLTTPFSLSTVSYSGISLSTQGVNPAGLALANGNEVLLNCDPQTDTVYQYTVGQISGTSAVVGGLTNGTSYTFNVWAINPFGWSSPSDASAGVSPAAPVGLFAGGDSSTNTIEYITLGSAGNATDFGDLDGSYSYGEQSDGGMGSGTRSIFVTGTNATQYVNPYSTGNAQLFGTLSTGRFATSACSNSIRGLIFTGDNGSSKLNVIDYVTIATTGNATDFGDDTFTRAATSSCANSLYATNNAGYQSSSYTITQQSRVTIATTGNATSFGYLANNPELFSASCSNSTYGLISGGYDPWGGSYWNSTERFTFTSSGSSVDWGDLTQQRYGHASTSNETTCFVAGGNAGSGSTSTNSIETRLFSSNGGWSDFGDLTVSRKYVMSTSTAHGGLS